MFDMPRLMEPAERLWVGSRKAGFVRTQLEMLQRVTCAQQVSFLLLDSSRNCLVYACTVQGAGEQVSCSQDGVEEFSRAEQISLEPNTMSANRLALTTLLPSHWENEYPETLAETDLPSGVLAGYRQSVYACPVDGLAGPVGTLSVVNAHQLEFKDDPGKWTFHPEDMEMAACTSKALTLWVKDFQRRREIF